MRSRHGLRTVHYNAHDGVLNASDEICRIHRFQLGDPLTQIGNDLVFVLVHVVHTLGVSDVLRYPSFWELGFLSASGHQGEASWVLPHHLPVPRRRDTWRLACGVVQPLHDLVAYALLPVDPHH